MYYEIHGSGPAARVAPRRLHDHRERFREALTGFANMAFLGIVSLELGVQEQGVYWSIVIAETTAALAAIGLFRRGTWKQIQI